MISPASRLNNVTEYFFSKKLKEVEVLKAGGVDVINLGIGSPDMMPPKEVIDTLNQMAHAPENHGYQSYIGISDFRKAIAQFHQTQYRISLDPDKEILPMMGSKEAIMHLSMAYLNVGDQVLIPALGYPTYSAVTRLVQAEPVYYPLLEHENWEPDWSFFEGLNYDKIKMLWINYPHMPTGSRGSKAILEKFVELCQQKNVLLCHDNPYSFILNDKPLSIFNIPGARDIAVELSSLSKTFNMAGWRVGWLAGKADVIRNVLKVKSNMDSGMFKPIQLAAVKALESDDAWIHKNNKEYAERRGFVFDLLDQLSADYARDQSGMFVWARIKEDAITFCDRLLYDKGIFLTPGNVFGESGSRYVRASLCVSQPRLQEAIKRLHNS